jgi:three-Cys-motif partner protein
MAYKKSAMQRYSLPSLVGHALRGNRGWRPAWREPHVKTGYDVVVIGGGGHGLATAYHLARKELENAGVLATSSVSLVEIDPLLFAELQSEVAASSSAKLLFEAPRVLLGEFANHIQDVLSRAIYSRSRIATFAFVDPCGVQGVRMADLHRLLSQPFGECLLFWNYDGINRILGGIRAGTVPPTKLNDLFGEDTYIAEALAIAAGSYDAPGRERALRDLFIRALRDRSGARFILPFRVEARDADRTSHYIIHCCTHPLAFKIMKNVMRKATSSGEAPGTFEYLNEVDTTLQFALFSPNADALRRDILAELSRRTTPIRRFVDEWPLRPDDLRVDRDYRDALLELETQGTIQVLKAEEGPVIATSERRRYRGKSTLPKLGWVRLTRV